MLELLPFSTTWVLVGLCVVLLYLYLVWPLSTFTKLGIPGPKPYPLFGSYMEYGKGVHLFDKECYDKYNKVYGFFEGRSPNLMIGDLELIKEITVKEFNKFPNRRVFDGQGEIFSKSVLSLLDGDWKRVRSAITPTFSSGKLKQMAVHIERAADGLVANLSEKEKDGVAFDMKQLSGCFTMDVISSTGFGVEVDSLRNPNHPLVTSAKAFFSFSFYDPMVIVLFLFPSFGKVLDRLGYSFVSSKAIKYFTEAIDTAIRMREGEEDGARPLDFLQLMLKAHNQELDGKIPDGAVKHGISTKEITANAIIMWVAGYETTANTLTLTAYNLALHQEIQDRVIEEIDSVLEKRGKLDYEAVNDLPYLEMCIQETLRMFPAALRFDRICKEDTEVKGLHIPAGMIVNIPVYPIHYDPDIWPEPEKFKPERFSKEEKEARDPYAYLPFGSGPRNCVGMRLAQVELRFVLAKILQKFRFVTCDKTVIPVRLQNTLGNQIEGELMLKVEARS